MIKGIAVTLHTVSQTGTDPFGDPIYTETPVTVNDVLVSPSSGEEITDSINLYGRKPIYTLAIPKGDTNEWENRKVSFFGKDWRAFGAVLQGIEDNIPLRWNRKVMVARYD